MKKRVLASLLAAFLLVPFADMAMAKSASDTVPTEVTSEKMQYDANKQQVVFVGNVYVKRPDFQIWSDTLTLYFEDKEGQEKNSADKGMPMKTGEVSRIVAEKNVRMDYDGKKGTCQKAIFDTRTGLLTMDGEPVLSDGDNLIKGAKILFYTEENRSEVIGGSQPVKAVFAAPSSKSLDSGKGKK